MEQIPIALDIQDTRLRSGLTQLISQMADFSVLEDSDKADIILTDRDNKSGQEKYYLLSKGQISARQIFPDLMVKWDRNRCFLLNESCFYPVKRKVETPDGDIILTDLETELLIFLYQHKGENCTKDMLLRNVWQYHSDVTTHTVETHIYRLRQKAPLFEEIITTRDNGYMLYLKDDRG